MINFKDIKQNFFINYYKYWIAVFIILIIFIISGYREYHFNTNKIAGNIKNAVYVGSGIAINKRNVIMSNKLISKACVGKYSGLKGNIFVIDKNDIFQVFVVNSNPMLNIAVLELKRYEDKLSAYALLDISDFDYKENENIIVPRILNKNGYFAFENGKILKTSDTNFFISVKNIAKKDSLLGMPIFNKNYILIGTIRSIADNFPNETMKDKILSKSSVQKNYFANGMYPIKHFLNNINIPYSMISGGFNFGDEKYNVRDSIVDVICIEKY
jgi:hypothetical protein